MAHGRGHVSWGEAAGVGAIVGILSMFRMFRIMVMLVVAIGLGLFLWDSWGTAKMLDQSQFSFSTSEPVLDEMDGGRPATISPLFNLNWTMRNKSKWLIETMQLNGELYRCDTADQDLDTCDYVRRENHLVTLNLPVGKHTSHDDQFYFTNPSGKAGVYRAKIWASDVFADTDKEY